MFKPILDRVNSHEPEGQKTLVVLGAAKNEMGDYLLRNKQIVSQFTDLLNDYYSVVFVTGKDAEVDEPENQNVHLARVSESVGEAHSLSSAMEYINTEQVTVAYADIDQIALKNISTSGILFNGDVFAGVVNTDSDILASVVKSVDPTTTLIQMGMKGGLSLSVINA